MPGKGLEDVIAVESQISAIVGDTLTYRGIPIEELAEHAVFEEVVYLLWYGHLPNRAELDSFNRDLYAAMQMPEPLHNFRSIIPASGDRLSALRTLLSFASLYDQDANERTHTGAIHILAALPVMIAALDPMHNLPEPQPELGLAANLLLLLEGKPPDQLRARSLDRAFIVHADHELNASTFTARIAGSALANLYAAVIAATCTLAGALHGGASTEVYHLLADLESPDAADAEITRRLAARQRIPGFGHRVYTGDDPRSRILRRMLEELVAQGAPDGWLRAALAVEASVTRRIPLHANLDFYAAPLYLTLGLPPLYLPLLFALARSAGWLAHTLEQYANNRLLRPRAAYIGPQGRHYVPLDQR